MAKLNDLDDVTIDNPKVGDVVKYTATGWVNGADAVSGGPGGNACGNLDDYLHPDKEAELSKPWVWKDAGCPSITVQSTQGADAGDQVEVCPGTVIVKSDTGLEGRFKSRGSDGQIEIRVNGGELNFRDDTVSPPVKLKDLVNANITAGTAFAPIIKDFDIDEPASNKSNTTSWDIVDNTVEFAYGANYSYGKLLRVVNTQAKQVTMPAGANAAIVFLQGKVQMSVPGSPDAGATGSQRALHCGFRVTVTGPGVTFPINKLNVASKNGFGEVAKGIVNIPGNTPSMIENYAVTKSFDKYDLITFSTSQPVLTIEPQLDVLKGGRGKFKAGAGRVIIYPFYTDNPTDFSIPGDISGFDSSADDAELDAIYEQISPDLNPAEIENINGNEYRDLLRRIVVSLESRKTYPPAGGASEAEFNAQIQAGWELVDNATLQTFEEFTSAFEVYYTEVTKEKYGIAILFQFEIEAGATTRSVI